MKKWELLGSCAFLALVAASLSLSLGYDPRRLGHDFSYYLPRLLDTYAFMQLNPGNIHWWTPTFAGGTTVFPHPQSMQFSLTQFLLFFSGPLSALRISMATHITLGGIFCFLLLRRCFHLSATSSFAGASLFSLNAFYINHYLVGHLGFQAFPLVSLLAFLMFKEGRVSTRTAAFSFVLASGVYSGGDFILLAWIGTLPFAWAIYLWRFPERKTKQAAGTLLLGGIGGAMISAPKLYATYSLMQSFPRLQISEPMSEGLSSLQLILSQLFLFPLKSLFLTPDGYSSLRESVLSHLYPQPFGYWEMDASFPVFSWLLLACAVLGFGLKAYRQPRMQVRQWTALACLFLFSCLLLAWIMANGPVGFFLKKLPILSSLHVNCRFIGILILPAVIILSWGTDLLLRNRPFLAGILLAVAVTGSVHQSYLYRHLFLDPGNYALSYTQLSALEGFYLRASSKANTLPTIKGFAGVDDSQALIQSLSSQKTHDSLYEYDNALFKTDLKIGALEMVDAGLYNVHFPPALVWPEFYQSKPFARIPAEDKQFDNFVNRKVTNWPLPMAQLLTLALGIFAGMACLWFLLRGILTELVINPKSMQSFARK